MENLKVNFERGEVRTLEGDRLKALEKFITLTEPERMSKHVRVMFIEYLANKHELLPINFHETLDDVSALFDLLDELAFIQNRLPYYTS